MDNFVIGTIQENIKFLSNDLQIINSNMPRRIDDLSDVNITSTPTNGEVLAYNSATEKFEPQAQSGGGGEVAPLYVDTSNYRVGINAPSPDVDFEVGNTFNVNNTNRRVGINNADPRHALDVVGDIRLQSGGSDRLIFNNTTTGDIADVDAIVDGTNGGIWGVRTKVDGGALTEKLRINNVGAIGIGGANYGSSGQFLKSNESDGAVSWGDALTGQAAPLYVDSLNNRVGINAEAPDVDFEVGNTFNVNDNLRRVGILNTNPTTTFQVGTTLNTNLTTERVGIGIVIPAEKLDVDSVIQITAQTASRASLYFSKVITPQVSQDLAEITSELSGTTNGGDLQFWTADNAIKTKKITINEKGAIGIGSPPNYGTAGQFLKTNESGSAVSWVDAPPPSPNQIVAGGAINAGIYTYINWKDVPSSTSYTRYDFFEVPRISSLNTYRLMYLTIQSEFRNDVDAFYQEEIVKWNDRTGEILALNVTNHLPGATPVATSGAAPTANAANSNKIWIWEDNTKVYVSFINLANSAHRMLIQLKLFNVRHADGGVAVVL